MIVTLTANPSLDRTVELAGALERGGVQRAVHATAQSGGKGVNVSRALSASGSKTLAVLPGDDEDPVLAGLRSAGVDFVNLPIGAPLRSNITLTEPDGTTTKVNEPGPVLTAAQQSQLAELALEKCGGAGWLVLAGSLPPGVPDDFYASLAAAAAGLGVNVAVDSSGPALAAVLAAGPAAGAWLLKPNAEELAELLGPGGLAGLSGWEGSWAATGAAAAERLEADPLLAAEAASSVVARGAGAVLATLGAKGAVLATARGRWLATHPPITARSTVGAGDSSLAGYLIAHSQGAPPEDCLRQAVAHGAAAASLPGSTLPALNQTRPDAVVITAI